MRPVPPSCNSSVTLSYLPAPNHLSAGNYAPHAILMMAVISLPANTAKAKTSIRRKSRARLWSIEGVRGKHPKVFPGLFSFARRFLFGEAKRKCRPFPLFPKRERKEWVQKRVQPQFAALQKIPLFFLGTRHSGAGPSTRMKSSPIRRMQHHGTT